MAVLKRIYRAAVPRAIRTSNAISTLKSHVLARNWIYDADFFRDSVEGPATRSAPIIAASIAQGFLPRSVIDFGCGTGALLEALREHGCEVHGLEYADAALEYCRRRHLDVVKCDLERDVYQGHRTFDLGVSLEVAEHLREASAGRYLDLLSALSPVVVFTAARPGQGGAGHLNEQPATYWIDGFQERGFEHLADLSARWQEAWKASGKVESWYYENLMVFRRKRS